MMRHHALLRAAFGVAAILLAACSGDLSLAPAVDGPRYDEGEEPVEVLYPSDAVYRGEASELGAGVMMSMSATSAMPLVRVAVLDSANNVPQLGTPGTVFLGGTGAWKLTDRSNGVTLYTGDGGSVQITLASIPVTRWRLQVTCSSVAAVTALRAQAEALGHPTYVETHPACSGVRLLIGSFPESAGFGERTAYKNLLISQGLAEAGAFWRKITLGQAIQRVHAPGGSFDNLNPVSVTAAEGSFVTIGTSDTSFHRFRGTAYAVMNSAGKIAAVNELPMEDYLRGVVPRELGPLLYPEVEAQKAQAVAARTYALVAVRGAKRSSDGYDIRGSTSDQVYAGFDFEQPMSNEAIDATAGIVAWHDGSLISALYSSASGGHTADSEEAYPNPVPYLKGVPDAERGNSFEHVPTLAVFKAHASPTSLRAVKESDFETEAVSRHRWTHEWSAEEIRAGLSLWKGFDVGVVDSIKVLERGPSGRALRIEYYTATGTHSATKDGIRTSLKFRDDSNRWQSMWSTLFFIEPVTEKGKWTGGFRVFGGGFGHGVGMSQTGAVGMASKGRTFDEILKHYYQGITLEPAY